MKRMIFFILLIIIDIILVAFINVFFSSFWAGYNTGIFIVAFNQVIIYLNNQSK